MNEPSGVRYWSKELGVSGSRLKALVKKVGAETSTIRHELAIQGNKSWQASRDARVQLATAAGSRRSNSFFTTA